MYGPTMQSNNKTLDYVKYSKCPPLAITYAIGRNGGLKTRDWTTRDSQKCRVWKRGTGKRAPNCRTGNRRKRHVWKAKCCTSHV